MRRTLTVLAEDETGIMPGGIPIRPNSGEFGYRSPERVYGADRSWTARRQSTQHASVTGQPALFQIKICGVRSIEDAVVAIDAGADAIGLNFADHSPRHVELTVAEQIAATIGDRATKVGVFVNATVERIRQIAERADLDLIQLHGDEPPEFCAELSGLRIMRAFRFRGGDTRPIWDFLDACAEHPPQAVLIDAFQPGKYGGTGEVVDWQAVTQISAQLQRSSVVLAGGLTPRNVARAIEIARPAAVDTASGVELVAGEKDAQLVRAFVNAARRAFLRGKSVGEA